MAEMHATVSEETDREYRAIERTLLETARGRWFLAEHGRRARRLDMSALDDAIGRLSRSLAQPPAVLALMRLELERLSALVAETKAAMVARSKPAGGAAAGETDAVPSASAAGGTPVARMLRMAEDIHELTWTLHADELSPDSCEAIARQASMLYAVSRQQAMESEKALKFASALDDAANRLSILLDTLVHEINTYDAGGAATDAASHNDVAGG
jgi:hypothetical protein